MPRKPAAPVNSYHGVRAAYDRNEITVSVDLLYPRDEWADSLIGYCRAMDAVEKFNVAIEGIALEGVEVKTSVYPAAISSTSDALVFGIESIMRLLPKEFAMVTDTNGEVIIRTGHFN